METDKMLRAIDKLRMKDGITYEDECDIRTWAEIAGEGYNTDKLSEKSVERIRILFHRHYQ